MAVSSFDFDNPIVGERLKEARDKDLEIKYKKVEKEADKTINSFSNLVNELFKLKEISSGSEVKDQITKLTNDLNNSSVFFAKMISDELSKLYKVLNPDSQGEEIPGELPGQPPELT